MQRYRILHRTCYNFCADVCFEPHTLRLRPRECHELRIEYSALRITPHATLRWRRDVEDNSVATATFAAPASQLLIESEVVIQQYNQSPLDFLVAPTTLRTTHLPTNQRTMWSCGPISKSARQMRVTCWDEWLAKLWRPSERIQTYTLLQRLCTRIQQTFKYQTRRSRESRQRQTHLPRGTGSCRDFASLFMETTRRLGLASRFVSGYLCTPMSNTDFGATHAWTEVFLPGAGWKGFDPTIGNVAGADHIAVAVARLPESVPPVAGSSSGLRARASRWEFG